MIDFKTLQAFFDGILEEKRNGKHKPHYKEVDACIAEADKITNSFIKWTDRVGLGRKSRKGTTKNIADYMKPSPVKVIDKDGNVTYKVDNSTPKSSSGIDKEYLYRNIEDLKQIAALVCAAYKVIHLDDYDTDEVQKQVYKSAYNEMGKYIYAQQRAEPVNMYSQEFDAIQREAVRDRYFYKEVDEFDILHYKLQEWGIATNRRRETVDKLEEYITLQLTVKNAYDTFGEKYGKSQADKCGAFYTQFKIWLK